MPFTLSHPAAVLPLLRGATGRGPLIVSGLVAGSMAPDVPFFADSLLPGAYALGGPTHRWWAVPTADVLLAGGLVGLWHGLVRAPLVDLLPGRWAAAAEAVTAPSGDRNHRFGWFAASAAVGAATHVGWDAFTHEGRAGVRALPALNRSLAGVPVHTVLQYGTSVLGLACVVRHAARVVAAAPPAGPPGPRPTARRAGRAVLAVATAGGVAHRLARRERGLIAEFCFGAGAGFAVGAAAYATVVKRLTARERLRAR
ncbi:DUF4184 family protein [Kitasatospora sp. MAP5-34]|uniref:DUF4184 family protein n=1 Tax=Kitasatospora sp. MAP5-34 TaxID=3035102 RepID=UPI002473F51C|nr:DUF4184 family protein [Kitasatospora sp. MAP5-34]MDH6579415.1 hypothetical protein [Kitasatospora sp. MAP5-34]